MGPRHSAPPTSSLPPLRGLATYTLVQVTTAIDNLRSIYCSSALAALPHPKALPKHVVHDTTVPDSGYASEDDEENECGDDEDEFDIDVLRSDTLERDFTIRWLTGFAARSDAWVYAPACSEAESDARAALVDAAAALLGTFAGADDEEAVTRSFTFSTADGAVHVELNDAPLLSDDHTSVGLQSWGSSIRLAERMCLNSSAFGLVQGRRVLELGAGTGLLSIAAAKLLTASSTIVATDYHPHVLDNLRANVATNFSSSLGSSVDVLPLDWQSPVYEGPLASKFDVVLAADVIYHPEHARWIKACVENLLEARGVCWLIVPLRPTGRHEGMSNTVDAIFPCVSQTESAGDVLTILSVEEMRKQDGVGRADEGGYKLYKIGWSQ